MGTIFADMGATATDNVDEDVEVILVSSDVNTSVAASYAVVYSATDAAGNIATITRTVIVGDGGVVPPAATSTPPVDEGGDVGTTTPQGGESEESGGQVGTTTPQE
jgi:hypothetical protein